MTVTIEQARLALPFLAELGGEMDPDTPEWAAVFAVQLEVERVIREHEIAKTSPVDFTRLYPRRERRR